MSKRKRGRHCDIKESSSGSLQQAETTRMKDQSGKISDKAAGLFLLPTSNFKFPISLALSTEPNRLSDAFCVCCEIVFRFRVPDMIPKTAPLIESFIRLPDDERIHFQLDSGSDHLRYWNQLQWGSDDVSQWR